LPFAGLRGGDLEVVETASAERATCLAPEPVVALKGGRRDPRVGGRRRAVTPGPFVVVRLGGTLRLFDRTDPSDHVRGKTNIVCTHSAQRPGCFRRESTPGPRSGKSWHRWNEYGLVVRIGRVRE